MLDKNKKTFYISSALPYVNAEPHIGFALEIIQADVLARYYRLAGYDVFFLTGTDENSLKNVQGAEKENMEIQAFVDRNARKFYDLKEALNLSFDDFIRTTESRHRDGAQKLWLAAQKDIYKKKYSGLYCTDCEQFYKLEELIKGKCPEHKKRPVLIEEENYFFKLSKYQNKLKELIETDQLKIVPQKRKKEALSFINQGLNDFCISRLAQRGKGWGIPVPGDDSQIMWTWFDALSNYINALDYVNESERFKKWWSENENTLHIIGKGILRFHVIYWPAILLSASIPLPKEVFIHGYINSEGQKMSKSLGNIVNPFTLIKKYGTDAVRYFLLREISSFEDGDFSIKRFKERYDADLANGIGNLVSRVLTLSQKIDQHNLAKKIENVQLIGRIKEAQQKQKQALEERRNFQEALEVAWRVIKACDEYIEIKKPWQLFKEDKKRFDLILSDLLIALREIAFLIEPFMPETAEKIIDQVNQNKKTTSLFPRLGK